MSDTTEPTIAEKLEESYTFAENGAHDPNERMVAYNDTQFLSIETLDELAESVEKNPKIMTFMFSALLEANNKNYTAKKRSFETINTIGALETIYDKAKETLGDELEYLDFNIIGNNGKTIEKGLHLFEKNLEDRLAKHTKVLEEDPEKPKRENLTDFYYPDDIKSDIEALESWRQSPESKEFLEKLNAVTKHGMPIGEDRELFEEIQNAQMQQNHQYTNS